MNHTAQTTGKGLFTATAHPSGKATFTSDQEWDPEAITQDIMNNRIRSTLSRRNWGRLIALIKKGGVPFEQLRVAEVGCGTGTASLMLAFLGASVTMIDRNEGVLTETRKCFQSYGVTGNFVRADCLEAPPVELKGQYHVVLSGGLAEHFEGEDRLRCFQYHRRLLRENGLADINVPNRFSPFLQSVVAFRRLTGTFRFSLEIPYTHDELMRIMREAGFRHGFVSGSDSLRHDALIYSAGLISAVVDLLPQRLSVPMRLWKRGLRASECPARGRTAKTNIKLECIRRMHSIQPRERFDADFITDHFASGLHLFAMT